MTTLKLKRAYDPQESTDGWRVYIDRLWPRGLSHETFHYDVWDKAISPSTELREWYHADPVNRWESFVERYKAELSANPAFKEMAANLQQHHTVTLLFSSRDTLHDNAQVVANTLLHEYPGKFRKE